MQAKNLLTTLTLIHGLLVLGLISFCGFVYWQNPSFDAGLNSPDIFVYLVPLVAAAGYFASKYLFQNLMQNIERNDGLQNKLGRYQLASIIKYALLEAPAFLALIAYYLNGNALHLVIALCLITYLISQRPTQKRLQNHLQLTREEQKQLEL